MKTQNIIDYAETVLEPFDQLPFSPPDSLILSWFSYFHLASSVPEVREWRGVRLAELYRAESFPALFHDVWEAEESRRLLSAMAASPRFRNIRVKGFTEQFDSGLEKQFAAVSLQLDRNQSYIAFRGTNTTLIGWKEDFNMAFQSPVPSQAEAARYLQRAARHCRGILRCGGHSKGGNLAVYAAAKSSAALRRRMERVYSHDGPGFPAAVLQEPGFHALSSRIHKTLPQSAVVGMLLEHQEPFRVVKSSRLSLLQHDPFSWEIQGQDFHYLKELAPDARYLNHTLSEWLHELSPEARERFVDSLYTVVSSNDAKTFPELLDDWKTSLPAIAKAATSLDEDTQKFLRQTLMELAALSLKNFPSLLLPAHLPGR